jgi:hypothetical protein
MALRRNTPIAKICLAHHQPWKHGERIEISVWGSYGVDNVGEEVFDSTSIVDDRRKCCRLSALVLRWPSIQRGHVEVCHAVVWEACREPTVPSCNLNLVLTPVI